MEQRREVEVWYKPEPDAEPVYWDLVSDDAQSLWRARCAIKARLGHDAFVFGALDRETTDG